MKLSIVLPTNRPDQLKSFLVSWTGLIQKHKADLWIVHDTPNKRPTIELHPAHGAIRTFVPDDKLTRDLFREKLIYTGCDSVRNLGFALAIQDGAEVIITLDDDVRPILGVDPIQQHLDALALRVPITWFSPYSNMMRGMPYGVRSEAAVMVSHGIWEGGIDLDAVSKIAGNSVPEKFPYIGPVPKGCLMPVCGMNLAFRREAADAVYFAPMGGSTGFSRFGDIWMGMFLKRWLDENDFALYHGASRVYHDSASEKFACLVGEAKAMQEHERKEHGDAHCVYWESYKLKRLDWARMMKEMV